MIFASALTIRSTSVDRGSVSAGDFSFCEEMRKRLYIHGEPRPDMDTWLRRLYLAAGAMIEVKKLPLSQRGDLILANSKWSADQLETCWSERRSGTRR